MGLSKGQLESLRALADTFCPSCEETSAAKAWRGDEPIDAVLWKTSAGDLPILIAKLVRQRRVALQPVLRVRTLATASPEKGCAQRSKHIALNFFPHFF